MKKRTLKLKSNLNEINRIEKFVEEICDEKNINNTYFGNILVAVTEAFENAVIHGNKKNEEKRVQIKYETREKGLMFEVCDEGDGFKYEKIPDATDIIKNPEKKGTGIYLIKKLADEVRHLNEGRKIQILFYIDSINQQMSYERMKNLNDYQKKGKEATVKKNEEK